MGFKSGFAAIIGRPNVGKSTLLNRFAGEKVAIISDKPQTTRFNIKAVATGEDYQIIFIDTPGIHKPKNKLGEYMVNMAVGALSEVDAVLFLTEATESRPGAGDLRIAEELKRVSSPRFLVINKIDLVKKEKLLLLIDTYKDLVDFKAIVPISALNNEGVDILLEEIKKVMPEGPKYFPEDMLTDQPVRKMAEEIIREKILMCTSQEVPHGVGVELISFKEREEKDIVDIQANIYCEKDSHKGILIGRGGSMLKEIGTLAREELEWLLGKKVFLQLWIKVKPDWRNDAKMLNTLGYK